MEALDDISHHGLSTDEAIARLRAEGPNELPQTGRRSVLRVILEVLREPMLLLLLIGGFVYLLLGDRPPAKKTQTRVYFGSLIVRGTAVARVLATGAGTEIGKIGQSLKSLDTETPRLRRETTRIVSWCAIAGTLVAGSVVVLYGLLRGSWLEAMLAGIAVSMSMLPEEFPVVLAVFMAMGAWRIGKVCVLTRRASAIETLGSATVLCTDKTGTLTENRMALAQMWLPSGETVRLGDGNPVSEEYRELIETAALASAPHPSDPMEIALHNARATFLPAVASDTLPLYTYGLRPDLLAMSNI